MVYYNKKFRGFWDVGTSAIVVADSKEEATELLNKELKGIGLKESAEKNQFVKIKTRTKGVIILQDGNY